MLPKFKPGEYVLTFNWLFLFRKLRVGEVIVFRLNNQLMVKKIQKINGRHYFVVGENQIDSLDSKKIGLVKKEQIIGQVIYKF